MEYEIEEEGELLDESNNPSLDHSTKQAIKNQSSVKPEDYPLADRKLQKAELIPEEAPKA
jgi:hypothetical protein